MIDLYPRDTSTYNTNLEAKKVPKGNPVNTKKTAQDNIVSWLEEAQDYFGSIDNIQLDLMTMNGQSIERRVSIEAQILANKMARDLFAEKAREFKDYIKEM